MIENDIEHLAIGQLQHLGYTHLYSLSILPDGAMPERQGEVLRPKRGLNPFFTDALARNRDFRDYAEGCLAGSSGRQRVELEHLMNHEIAIPDAKTIEKFNTVISPIVPKLHANVIQVRTLEKLRDELLPQLMSGEVQVSRC